MKTVKELAIQLENKPGALADISELLAANAISILALTVRAQSDTGTLHIIASDPQRAEKVLESSGFTPKINEILAVETPRHPGGLNVLFKALKAAGVNIDYLYSFVGTLGESRNIILMQLSDVPRGYAALEREWVRAYGDEIYGF